MTNFADDGDLDTCCWCGKPAADGEPTAMVQYSSRQVWWMHLNCASLYSESCKKEEVDFFANNVLKFVRGEPSGIKPGTVGEARAKIAKDLIAKTSSLALPENLQEFIAAVEAVERERAIAEGRVVTLSEEEIAMGQRVAGERIASRDKATASSRAGRMPANMELAMNTPMTDELMEKIKKDEMSHEVCEFAHGLMRRGGCPLDVVQALIAGTLAFAGRIGEDAMRRHISECDELDHLVYQQSRLSKSQEDALPF